MKRIVVVCLLVLPWLAMGCAGVWLLERLSVEEVFELLNRQSVSMAYVLSQWKSVGLGSLGLRYTFSAVWGPVLFWILLVQVLGIVCVWGMDRFYRKKEERLLQETACESFSDDSPLSRQIQKRLVQKERRIAYVEGQRLSGRRDFENTLHEIRSKLMTLYFMETEAEREEVIEGADALIRQFLRSAVYEACSLKALVSRALSGRGPLFKELRILKILGCPSKLLVKNLGSLLERIALAGDLEILKQDRQVQARVSWPHMDEALFADEKTGLPDERWGLLVQPDEEGIPSLYRPVTETAWMPFVQQLKDSVSEGSVDWHKWSQGEEAIVSLPPVVLGETEVSGSWKGRIDDSLRVGDVIALEMPDGTKTLPVTGIIRSDFSLPVYGVYLGGDRVNRVQLALRSRENRVPAELFLSRITSENDLVFNNVAQWTSVRLQSLRMDMVLQAGMILFAVSMELYGVLFIRRLAADRKRSYLERFVRVGVPEDIVMEVDRKNRHRQWIMGMAVIGLVGFFMTVWMAFSYVGPQFPWVQILIGILLTLLTGFTMVRA